MHHALDMFYPEAVLFVLAAALLVAAWVRGAWAAGGMRVGRAGILLSGWLVLFALRADYGNINTYVAAAFLVGAWALGRAVPRRVLWALLLLVLLYDLWYGCRGLFSGISSRLGGWSANPNTFADSLLPLVAVAGGIALFFHGARRWAAFGLCVPALAVFVLTGSRAAMAGALVVGLLYLWLCVLRRRAPRLSVLKRVLAAGVVLLLAGASLYGLYRLRPASAQGRLLMYRVSAASVVQHPAGRGLVSFSHAYSLDQAAYFERHPYSTYAYYASDTRSCFNELLQVGYELGWAGIALFAATIWYLLRIPLRGRRGLLAAKVALLGMLAASMFAYPLRSYPTAALYAVFFALMLSYDREALFTQKARIWARIAVLAAGGVLLVFVCWYVVRRYDAYRRFDGVCTGQTEDPGDILAAYRACYPVLRNEGLFLRSYAQDLSFLGDCHQSNRIYREAARLYVDHQMLLAMGDNCQALGDYPMAEYYYLQAHHTIPNKFVPLYRLMLLHRRQGNQVQAATYARTILGKEAKVPSAPVERMRAGAQAMLDSIQGAIPLMPKKLIR